MTVDEAAGLIDDPRINGSTWADLGCGDGTFTMALASLLPSGSSIHAVDRDAASLRRMPASHAGVSIVPHVADFTRFPLPCAAVDGVLMANSLHYVEDPLAWLRQCMRVLARRRFLIVEYDTDRSNPWVPYPLSRSTLARVFHEAGFDQVNMLGSRPSIYGRAALYAALAVADSAAA